MKQTPESTTPEKPQKRCCGRCTYRQCGIGVAVLVVCLAAAAIALVFYEKKYDGPSLPYITPPVQKAAPVGLGGSPQPASGRFKTMTLDPSIVQDRFFNTGPQGGPSNLFDILGQIDGRIQGINSRLSYFGCMNNAPTGYSISSWNTAPQFFAQCSETWSSGDGFDQWALLNNNSTFYLYARGGDGIQAAIATLDSNRNVIEEYVWYSVGINNPHNGSHGVVQIYADPVHGVFELTAAGAGLGFCGAQLRSDSSFMNVTGSIDMGTTCTPTDSVCCDANTLAAVAASSCASDGVDSFSLPPLGREAYGAGQFGASQYPGGAANQVVLTTSGDDDAYFGPSAPVV